MVRRRLAGRAPHNAVPLCPDLGSLSFRLRPWPPARCDLTDPRRRPPDPFRPCDPELALLVTAPPPGAG